MSKLQSTLGADNSEKLREFIRKKESGSTEGNYTIENKFGYIGAYQFGAQALQDQGLIKPGVVTDYAKLGANGHKAVLDNPANWNNPPGSKDAFLANKALQDQAFDKLADNNYKYLTKKGVIGPDTPPADVAGYVSASHLVGAGSVAKYGLTKTDANGTSAGKYFNEGKGYVSGKTGFPPSKPGGTAAEKSTAPAKREVYDGAGRKLRDTGVGNSVTIGEGPPPDTETIQLPLPNPLSTFSSFNAIITLSSITETQHKKPLESYKAGDIGEVVLRSAGAGSKAQETLMTTRDNPSGQYDFFIDNLEMQSIISHNQQTKGSNATDITFEVKEPYSMGVFLQACEIAARKNGWKNGYLNSVFLLTIEFVGYDDAGDPINIPLTTRHIPITIKDIAMNVKSGGSTYIVKGHPSNEIVHNNNYSLFQSDIAVSGKTVKEILQTGEFSLQTVLNKRLQEMAEAQKAPTLFDEIVIVFPKPGEDIIEQFNPATGELESATSRTTETITVTRTDSASNLVQDDDTLNTIGQSVMDFDSTTGGQTKVNQQNAVQEDPSKPVKKSKVVNDTSTRQFIYSQGTSIVNAISSILQNSKYCKDALDEKNIDEMGMVNWFRIESQVDYRTPKEGNIGNNADPKLLIFKIVPYKAHSAKISSGASKIKGYDKLRAEAAKVYDYIYTGKNTEILNLEIEFQRAFFNTVTADQTKGANTASQGGRVGAAEQETAPKSVDNRADVKDTNSGNVSTGYELSVNSEQGGTESEDYRTIVAKQFQKALYDSRTDLMTATMTIFGDPYYLADSGMGNFSNSGTGRFNVTDSNSMDYQSGEVDIIINFRTPLDYGDDGIMSFGNTEIVESFSGLYKVNFVLHRFQRGKFTQELKLQRRTRQSADSVEDADKSNTTLQQDDDGSYDRAEAARLNRASANPNQPDASNGGNVVSAPAATGLMSDAEKNEVIKR